VNVNVALTPALLRDVETSVCIVVDVLRASSACIAMFDSGVEAIGVAPDPESARVLRSSFMPDALLCGEVGGLPPPGFDYGNSPIEFSRLSLAGRRVVLATSNGTRALHAVSAATAVFVGCLLNCEAVAVAAVDEALRTGSSLQVVCAGNDYGASFSLDDTVAAGAIVRALRAALAGRVSGEEEAVTDAALMAGRLFDGYATDLERAFLEGSHGRGLERLGFSADLAFCATLDRSRCVPYLSVQPDALLLIRA
jgi:2-phosphosulfolactate phosphatase